MNEFNIEQVFSCEEAALEVTFKFVNQSNSVMLCNFRHSDQLVCVCLPSWSHGRNSEKHYMWSIVKMTVWWWRSINLRIIKQTRVIYVNKSESGNFLQKSPFRRWSHWQNLDKHYMWSIVKVITLTELRYALHVKHCEVDHTNRTQISISVCDITCERNVQGTDITSERNVMRMYRVWKLQVKVKLHHIVCWAAHKNLRSACFNCLKWCWGGREGVNNFTTVTVMTQKQTCVGSICFMNGLSSYVVA